MIYIPDDTTDTSPFCLPVQTAGGHAYKLALCLIVRWLGGNDARIVHTQHDEIIVEARDDIEDQVKAIVKDGIEEAFRQIIPEVPFVVEPRASSHQ